MVQERECTKVTMYATTTTDTASQADSWIGMYACHFTCTPELPPPSQNEEVPLAFWLLAFSTIFPPD